MTRSFRVGLWLSILTVGVAAGFFVMTLRGKKSSPKPRAIIWDRETCEECSMSVSDPAFACQMQTQDGRIFDFDDPGCLWTFQAKEHVAPQIVFYAQNPPGVWLNEDGASFLKGFRSPMGFGMKAVPRGTAGALSPGEARALMVKETSQEAHP